MNGRLRWTTGLVLVLALSTLAETAAAQIFTPTYMAPRRSADIGVYLSDGPGEFAIEGIMRRNFTSNDLGLRLGVADLSSGAALLLGGELKHPLAIGDPLDMALTASAQGVIGDDSAIGLDLGLTFGHTFVSPGLNVTPYLHPRIGVVNGTGPDDDFDLEVLADLGINLDFSPRMSLRVGFAFGDPGAGLGVGFAWR